MEGAPPGPHPSPRSTGNEGVGGSAPETRRTRHRPSRHRTATAVAFREDRHTAPRSGSLRGKRRQERPHRRLHRRPGHHRFTSNDRNDVRPRGPAAPWARSRTEAPRGGRTAGTPTERSHDVAPAFRAVSSTSSSGSPVGDGRPTAVRVRRRSHERSSSRTGPAPRTGRRTAGAGHGQARVGPSRDG